MNFPLQTNRLSITPLGVSDIAAFTSYRQDPELARYQSWDENYSLDQARALVASQAGITNPARGEWLQLAIHRLEDGLLVGDLALHAMEEDSEFELGFTIAKEHQRLGYAKEASQELLRHLFTDHSASLVIAQPDTRNTASIRTLQALGFKQNPERTWQEFFKGEDVTVSVFELWNMPELG